MRDAAGRGVALVTVSADCGFCDQAQLFRQFRAAVGVTPNRYRLAAHGESGGNPKCSV